MIKKISFDRAVQWSLFLFGLVILFHFAVIVGILLFDYVPIDFLWVGRMETEEQLLVFEVISLLITILCFLVVLMRSGRISIPGWVGAARIVLWILFLLFVLNTVGNVVAKTNFEKSFALVTAMLATLCLRLALEPTARSH